jgi:microcin C transport system substrate-binding protein
LVNRETGQPFRFEILLVSPAFERIVLPYVRNLKRLGIEASVRLVDESQYINRMRDFDFDMAVIVWGQSESPGNEQRSFWTAKAADTPGSRNFAGIRDPVVDELIELVITASDRDELIARTRALDRVLLAGHYVVPGWHSGLDRILYWDMFSRPEITPARGPSIETWWFDEARAERLSQRRSEVEGGAVEETGRGTAAVVLAFVAGLAVLGYLGFRRALARAGRGVQR